MNSESNEWEVSYDNGGNWSSLGVNATGATIESVAVNNEGKLVITMTDGTEFVVDMPEAGQHAHTFGDLIDFEGNSKLDCDKRIYYSVCSECYELKWTYGKPDDHVFATSYSNDGYYHWFNCTKCNAKNGYEEHDFDTGGYCSICEQHLTASSGIEYELSEDETYAIAINYTGNAERIMVSDTYQGVPVTEIGSGAFEETDIVSVVLPDTITVIGDSAFYSCDQLVSADIGDSVEIICERAFFRCYSLTDIVLPEGLISIEYYAFASCQNLETLDIPDSVTTIENNAFLYCYKLITVENGVSYVDNWAVDFDDTHTSVTLKDGTVGISDQAFESSNKLRSVTVPDSVIHMGAYAFSSCANLSEVSLDEGLETIGISAFRGCGALASITIPDSVTVIGNDAFSYCDNLSAVTLGNGIKTIGSYAFQECNISSIVLPRSIETLGNSVFYGCWPSIYYLGSVGEWDAGSGYTIFYYSDTEPEADGNTYWRYVDGVPTVW